VADLAAMATGTKHGQFWTDGDTDVYDDPGAVYPCATRKSTVAGSRQRKREIALLEHVSTAGLGPLGR
jgi:hypothetical protein